MDTDENAFGGFTPLEWESRVWNGKASDENNWYKRDDSLKNLPFTLKNPRKILAKEFALKADRKQCWLVQYLSSLAFLFPITATRVPTISPPTLAICPLTTND
jgi:hypothetical protein